MKSLGEGQAGWYITQGVVSVGPFKTCPGIDPWMPSEFTIAYRGLHPGADVDYPLPLKERAS